MITPSAFTFKSDNGLVRVLKTNCGVCIGHVPNPKMLHPEVVNFLGIWDTGATGTVISKNVVDKLHLMPIGKVKAFHADGESIVNVYVINLFLPNRVAFPLVRVTEGKLNGADLLIGMDIITQGDLSVTNINGKTTFSFRLPSMKEIDYVKEYNDSHPDPNLYSKVGRNDPCPCGSGKKYKTCHGIAD